MPATRMTSTEVVRKGIMMNKEKFEIPELEIVMFENEDVITTSNFQPDPDEGPFVPME